MTSLIRNGIALLGFFVINAQVAFADVVGGPKTPTSAGQTGLVNPLKDVDSLPEFLTAILNGVVEIGTIILVMMLVYVGFQFVAARGNAEKLQGAKSALVWTVIGGLILLGATAIQLVIEGTVNTLRI